MFTVLGAGGFIGSHVVDRIRERGHDCLPVLRGAPLPSGDLGHLIYCIGMTADFRERPLDTIDAHVARLLELGRCRFDSLVYLSSTRVYKRARRAVEDEPISILPDDPDDLYDISKAAGEALALALPHGRVVRLSNVYGADFGSRNFLSTVITEAVTTGAVTLRTTADSSKDYVDVASVADVIVSIASEASQRIYNVARGQNVSNVELLERLATETGCTFDFAIDARRSVFPTIDNERVRKEYDFAPRSVLDDIPALVQQARVAATRPGGRASTTTAGG